MATTLPLMGQVALTTAASSSSDHADDSDLESQTKTEVEKAECSVDEDDKVTTPLPKWAKWMCTALIGIVLVLLSVAIGLASGLPLTAQKAAEQAMEDAMAKVSITRRYYIAAEPVMWKYAPGGDQCFAPLFGTLINRTFNPKDIEGELWKGHYVMYTDETYNTVKDLGPNWAHLGMIGPPIHAEAGDLIELHLRNSLPFPVNLEPTGAVWQLKGLLTDVQPNRTVIYTIQVPLEAGPAEGLPESSRMYVYHSTLNPTKHDNTGLVGPLIVTRKGWANTDGTPKDVDREIVTYFQIYFEQESSFNLQNAETVVNNSLNVNRYTINGYAWCNIPALESNIGERVRWYIGAIGSENGLHNFHWHGNVLSSGGHNVDQFTLLPGNTLAAGMSNDNPGTWFLHCHVNSHLDSGMTAMYTVKGPRPAPTTGGKERVYYIAADEVEWDYAPLGGEACTADGSVKEFGTDALTYLGAPEEGGTKIGSKYLKAMFREYTDATFTTLKPRPEADAYLGILGPVIRAQVGDTLKIHFKNQLSSHPATMHPHGVLYDKASEGAPYNDGTTMAQHGDDAVLPGQTWTYTWEVPERAGPGKADPSSLMWMYHSHADETTDTYAGLYGAMIFTNKGTPVHEDGTPVDVDQELLVFFSKVDENMSTMRDANIQKYLPWWSNDTETLIADESYLTSQLHHSINGFMYCNMPVPEVTVGSRVRFHVMVLGDQTDMHTPRLGRGGGFMSDGMRTDALQMTAGAMRSVDVLMSEPGRWELDCGVEDHFIAGMRAQYQALPSDTDLTVRTGKSRTYYIQAEYVDWDFGPGGYNKCTLKDYTFRWNIYMTKSNVTVGSKYKKAMYRQYTDATFTQLAPVPAYLGILGPVLKAEVGDNLVVVLRNALQLDVNLQPDGGLLAQHDEVAGEAVAPGASFTYDWVIPVQAGPGPEDLSTVTLGYTSSVDPKAHQMLGLVGILVTALPGTIDFATGLPKGVDAFMPLLWQVYNENASPLLTESMKASGLDVDAIDLEDEDFMEANMHHGINGYMYCTMPPPTFKVGQRVRWAFLSIGSEEGSHAPVFTGQVMLSKTGPVSSSMLMPYNSQTYDMVARTPGSWPFWCQVHDHVEAGMMASMTVLP